VRSDETREPIRGKGKRQKRLLLGRRDETARDLDTAEVTGSIPVAPTGKEASHTKAYRLAFCIRGERGEA